MAPKSPDLALIRKAAMSRRSTLYVWLLNHYQSFSAVLAKTDGLFRWADIANGFAAEGLTDSRGNPPTAATAEATWARVRKAVAARKPRKQKPAGRARPPAPGIVRPVVGMAPVSPEQPTERPRTKFVSRPAVFKSLLPKKDRTNAVE
jgi:hypothetical protein